MTARETSPPETTAADYALDRRLVMLGVVVVPGSLLSVLDTTIVNVATHTLGSEFNAPISTIQWVLTGYMLAFASIIPVAGWAVDRFGARRVWIGSLLLFVAASVLAGAAWSAGSLIVFRILQGIGGGMIPPVGQAILAQAAGPRQMGRVMSMVAVPTMLGSVAGPVFGGLIVSSVGWRWIFFLNLPLGVIAVLAARWLLPASGRQTPARLDLTGLLLLSTGVATFVYGMSEAGSRGGFESVRALAGLGAGLLLVALYGLHARARGRDALIDLALLRDRAFAAAISANFVVTTSLFGVMILLPLYWQIVRGESPLATGLLLAPQTFGMVLATPLAGRMTDRIGAGVVVPVGILLALLGTAIYTQVGADTSYALGIAGLFVIGLGLGGTNTPLTAAAYATLPNVAIPGATSALNTAKRLGASIGTAALAIVLQHMMTVDGSPARAFAQTFWVAFALTAVALVPAVLLPRRILNRRVR